MNEQEKEALKRVASHYGITYCEDLDITVKYLSEPKPPHPVVVRKLPPPKPDTLFIFEKGKPNNLNNFSTQVYITHSNISLWCEVPTLTYPSQ
jgi:hypothetical protein